MPPGGSPLAWYFELFDRITPPATRMVEALNRLNGSMKQMTERLDRADAAHAKLAKAQAHAGEATGSFRHKLFETLEIGHRVADMFEAVTHHAIEFGSEIIKAASGTELATMAFGTFLGKGRAAREELEKIERIAPATAMQGNELRNLSLGLARSGFRGEQLTAARAAALDIAALNPTNPQAGAGAAAMLSTFRERGGIKDTRQLRELAAQTGVGLPELQSMLAAQFNTKVGNVHKLIESGKVTGEHAIQLVYDAIQKQTGGPLGKAAEEHGRTVDALMHKIKGYGEDLFEGLNTSKGYEQFRGFLENIQTVFTGPQGGALKNAVGDLFDTVMDMVLGATAGPKGLPTMERAIKGITGAVEQLNVFVKTARDVWNTWGEGITVFAEIAGTFLGVVGTVAGAVKVWEAAQWALNTAMLANPFGAVLLAVVAVGAAIYQVVTHWRELWQLIKDTLNSGGAETLRLLKGFITLEDANPELARAHQLGKKLGDNIKNGAHDALEIHSPSRVFERLGAMSAKGFADGFTRDAPVIDIGAARSARAAAVAGGERRVVIDLRVSIDGSEQHHDLATEIKEQLRSLVREEVADAGERYALEMGVA